MVPGNPELVLLRSTFMWLNFTVVVQGFNYNQ